MALKTQAFRFTWTDADGARVRRFRVFIPANDHRQAHVHVAKAGNEAVFILNCPDGPVSLRENYGFKPRQLNAIESELNPIVGVPCAEWEKVHGQP